MKYTIKYLTKQSTERLMKIFDASYKGKITWNYRMAKNFEKGIEKRFARKLLIRKIFGKKSSAKTG